MGQLGKSLYLDSLRSLVCYRRTRFYDDWRKVVYKDPNGVSAKFKMVWQSSVAIIAGLALFYLCDKLCQQYPDCSLLQTSCLASWCRRLLVLSYLTIVGTSNAVNLTDGLTAWPHSPLCLLPPALPSLLCQRPLPICPIPVIALRCRRKRSGDFLYRHVWRVSRLFLWFNAYPAQVFMGDVGALALGAALGTVAVIIRQEFVLVIMGGLFVVEAISVMLQVGWYKRTQKKRIFLMAPIHHHYEQKAGKKPKSSSAFDYHHRLGADWFRYPQNPLNLKGRLKLSDGHYVR